MYVLSFISMLFIPLLITMILVYSMVKRAPAYEYFVEGGKEGLHIAVSILPFLIGMLVAISVFRASGILDALLYLIEPLLNLIGVPAEVIPLAIIRPISGNAALGMLTDIISNHGPDSFIGRMASTIQGSTDTTFYVLTIYFGAVGIKKMGDALKVGLLADIVGITVAICIITLLFSS